MRRYTEVGFDGFLGFFIDGHGEVVGVLALGRVHDHLIGQQHRVVHFRLFCVLVNFHFPGPIPDGGLDCHVRIDGGLHILPRQDRHLVVLDAGDGGHDEAAQPHRPPVKEVGMADDGELVARLLDPRRGGGSWGGGGRSRRGHEVLLSSVRWPGSAPTIGRGNSTLFRVIRGPAADLADGTPRRPQPGSDTRYFDGGGMSSAAHSLRGRRDPCQAPTAPTNRG